MERIKSSSRKIDTVFVMALFAIFAATTLFVVLISAKQYNQTAETMEKSYEHRTATSYLREVIRQHDTASCIDVTEFSETDALSFTEEVGDYSLITYVYYYDGYIRELSITEGAVVTPASGSELIEASGMTISYLSSNLIQIDYIDTKGESQTLFINLHSPSRKEAS